MAEAAAGNGVVLELDDIHTYYGAIHALKGVSLKVHEGEVVTLIGANGAGKSTTLRSINGVNHPREGRISFQGRDITDAPPHTIVKMGIAQSPEGRRLFPRMSVIENLEMGAFQRDDRAELPGGHGPRLRPLPAPRRAASSRRRGRCRAASSRWSRWGGR